MNSLINFLQESFATIQNQSVNHELVCRMRLEYNNFDEKSLDANQAYEECTPKAS